MSAIVGTEARTADSDVIMGNNDAPGVNGEGAVRESCGPRTWRSMAEVNHRLLLINDRRFLAYVAWASRA